MFIGREIGKANKNGEVYNRKKLEVKTSTQWKKNNRELNYQTKVAKQTTVEVQFKVKVLESAKGKKIRNIAMADDTPSDPEDVDISDVSIKNKPQRLPNSGIENHSSLIYLGVFIIVLFGYLVIKRKIKK